MLENTGESVLRFPNELIELVRADEGGFIDLGTVSSSAGNPCRFLKLLESLCETCSGSEL